MQVNLKCRWFGPGATLYKPEDNPHTFDASVEGLLPKGAEVIGRGVVGSLDYDPKGKLVGVPKDEGEKAPPAEK